MLGPFPGIRFVAERITLEPGDTLFLYPDGVTEARNGSDQFFGASRLLQSLQRHAGEELEAMVHGLRREVNAFVDGAPASDDLTKLAIRYRGAAC